MIKRRRKNSTGNSLHPIGTIVAGIFAVAWVGGLLAGITCFCSMFAADRLCIGGRHAIRALQSSHAVLSAF
jgi:hypothetical protein